MKALLFDGSLRLSSDYTRPVPDSGWAAIDVALAGICRTDIEICRGYMDFRGVLGHEFCGRVTECADREWVGKRVVGEINAPCGQCDWCRNGLGRHCPKRCTLGIQGLNGCMAETCVLPVRNLHTIPPHMTDEQAVFIEPLSAAYEILDQVAVQKDTRCVVLGDGKLGILCAWVLSTVAADVTLVGHHESKLERARWSRVQTVLDSDSVAAGADLVVEATGRPEGLARAMTLCKPRGTVVLKSTVATQGNLDLTPIVINELNVIGSRCGLFSHGLAGWETNRFPLEQLITGRYPLDNGMEAFRAAEEPDALKILVEIG